MTKDRWVQSALTNDVVVAELLLRIKHSSDKDTDSLPIKKDVTATTTIVLPPRWGHHKSRSKSTPSTSVVKGGHGKERRRSPTTHLSWSGGGSSSDGYDDLCRPSDLSSGCRSVKANEGASISSYNKFDQNHTNKMRKMELCCEKAETEGQRRGFVLPDLNMTPNEDDLSVMVMI